MTSFCVKLAEIVIEIHALYPTTRKFFKDYLTDGNPLFSVYVSREDLDYEQEQSDLLSSMENGKPIHHTGPYLETLAIHRKIAEEMLNYDVLLFHGSAVAVDGWAYLFTAPSGTGKSTHARLWREFFGSRAVMINDDKPFLKCTEKGIIAYGTPWNGKHHLGTNTAAPLKAVCILTRDAENYIERISVRDALLTLYIQGYHSEEPSRMEKTLVLIGRISRYTALYRLGCNMEPEAAKISYEGMQEMAEK